MAHSLGSRLKQLRTDRKIRQVDAAVAAGIGRSHLSKVENDEDAPSLEMLVGLAVAYRVPLREVLPPGHPLSRAELVLDEAEIEWLSIYRTLPIDEARALLSAMRGRRAA